MKSLRKFIEEQIDAPGNCMGHCLSLMLDIPITAVPNFTRHEDPWEAVDSYLYAWSLRLEIYDVVKHKDIRQILHYGLSEKGVPHIEVCDKEGNSLCEKNLYGGHVSTKTDKLVIIPIEEF